MRDSSDRKRGNARTRMVSFDGDPIVLPPAPSGEVAFIGAYAKIRSTCLAATGPGIALFAVDDEGMASEAVIYAKSETIQTAIVGRHSEADLVLADDARISLRHLAVVICPDQGPVTRYHVLDLRTPLGMTDERQTVVGHLATAGPMLLTVGRYAIIAIPVGRVRQWPADPLAAWRGLPPRDYQTEATSSRRMVADGYRLDPAVTAVQVLGRPRFAQRTLADEAERPLGNLIVSSKRGNAEFVIGSGALQAGVLLGRYQRCDNADLPLLADHRISRVHLLLLSIDDTLYGIDTASTNGVWHDRVRFRHRPVAHGDSIEFGSKLAHVTWRPVD
ncbi:MAG: FHA domain-containing protein [Myxococcota bacterium]